MASWTSGRAPSMLRYLHVWKNKTEKTQNAEQHKNPVSDNNKTTFLSQKSSMWSFQLPDIYGLLLKEEGMLYSGKHEPVSTFLKHADAIKFIITSFFIRFFFLIYILHPSIQTILNIFVPKS